MERSWQDVLDTFHYGIYLVTITADGGHNGMIASWVTQVSHDPPLVALAIRKNRLSHTQIKTSGKFSINVLPKNLLGLVRQFKIPDWKKKFDGIEYELSPHGTPVIKEALGYLDCMVERTVDAGDHTLFISRITAGEMKRKGDTLSTDQYNSVYRGDK
ncbi:MAG TPA: flavin reductase family protein [Deltaproteobacteria bacterium]|nr:flavin reductase family protein [Deltaproteobacteria bacterium]HPJ94087.1 flavin reductase family protein [Deltaproteobacteria bacterium]HPR50970.1 flavin reductase family protein [Deltaproteobacteria bacterium]